MMGGFKNAELNKEVRNLIFEGIIDKILICSEMMVVDCINSNISIENHEEKIRNYLYENYLNNNYVRNKVGLKQIKLGFIIEAPEKYNVNEKTYLGRVDIKVVSENWFRNCNDYFIIECKRIDGGTDLNKKYVDNGVCRFATNNILYSSNDDKNIMFGFVVKDINVDDNTTIINKIQNETPNLCVKQEFTKADCKINNSYIYLSKYTVKEKILELRHLFHKFSEIIKQKPV